MTNTMQDTASAVEMIPTVGVGASNTTVTYLADMDDPVHYREERESAVSQRATYLVRAYNAYWRRGQTLHAGAVQAQMAVR